MMKGTTAVVLLFVGAFFPVPEAHAAKSSCEVTLRWTSPWTADTWTFQQCRDTMSVKRSGGRLGPCTNSYPVGTRYTGPESDCAYSGPI